MLEDVNYINNNYYYYYNRPQQNLGWNQRRPNYSERQSRTPRHPDFHRYGGLPKSTLRLWLQRQHYTQGRPFLNTSRAVIHASAAKISFYIKGRKETFSFKNKITQISEQSWHELGKRTNTRNNNKQMGTKSAKMGTAAQGGQDRELKSPFLIKKDDPGVPSIECTINEYSF